MPNIKFSYFYRDGANYKRYGVVVFSNPSNINLNALATLIRAKLIYGEFFYAESWKLPSLFFEHCDFIIDPTWHEFEKIEYTEEPAHKAFFIDVFARAVSETV